MGIYKNLKAVSALVACLTIVGCGGNGCGGSDTLSIMDSNAIVTIEPCIVSPGSTLWVYGSFPNPGATTFSFPGATASVTPTAISNSRAVLTVPAGVVSGGLAANSSGNNPGFYNYTVGTLVTVNEVEPNDAVDGSNATTAGNNRTVTGTLSSPADADHFTFGCVASKKFRVTLTGTAALTEIFIEGLPLTLAGGVGTFTVGNTATTILIGLTGATGNYTLTLTPVD